MSLPLVTLFFLQVYDVDDFPVNFPRDVNATSVRIDFVKRRNRRPVKVTLKIKACVKPVTTTVSPKRTTKPAKGTTKPAKGTTAAPGTTIKPTGTTTAPKICDHPRELVKDSRLTTITTSSNVKSADKLRPSTSGVWVSEQSDSSPSAVVKFTNDPTVLTKL